jgi:uncharacterized membrane protein YhhN
MEAPAAVLLLSMLAFACGATCIRAERRGSRRALYVSKPATMLCVIAIAALGRASPTDPYALAILAGLVLSLAGDVWLMLPSDRFAAGLASFFVAHLCYVVAFAGPAGPRGGWLGLLLFAAVAGWMLALLLPGVRGGARRVAVVLYVANIAAMGWQASERALDLADPGAWLAAAGALLFLGSDSALAWNRFRRPLRGAETLVLSTYFGGQWLIALSTGAGELLLAGDSRALAAIAALDIAP